MKPRGLGLTGSSIIAITGKRSERKETFDANWSPKPIIIED